MSEAEQYKVKIEIFKGRNKAALNDPLKKSFLENPYNNYLFEQAVMYDFDKKTVQALENAFQEHYQKIREAAYYNKTIHQLAVDFDKKQRKQHNRFLLTLDKPLSEGEETSLKDLLTYDDDILAYYENDISDQHLLNALHSLTEKQRLVIEYCIIRKLPNTEVAKLIHSTPQNVSNIKNKALSKLRKLLKEGDYNGRNRLL